MLRPGRSYLVSHPTDLLDKLRLEIPTVDQTLVESSSVNVASLRQLLAQVQQSPLSSHRLLWLNEAEKLSEVMQNTLLKTLEEPPPVLIVVVQTNYPERLLPTVRSRLHPMVDGSNSATRQNEDFNLTAKQLESLADRQELITYLSTGLRVMLVQILDQPNELLNRRIDLLDRAILKLRQNTNLKLTVDWLLVHWED